MISRLGSMVVLIILLIAGTVGYRLVKEQVTVDVYRRRLVTLDHAYGELRQQYNQAISRSAITELLVQDGRVRVIIRTPEGILETVDTPFDPEAEIYVDYALIDGRLWMRRVFDAHTSPQAGVVINPKLININWDSAGATHGKAAYRKLSPGRWAVTVTGDGSLGLTQVGPDDSVDLVTPPPIQDYQPIETEVRAEVEAIGWLDVVQWLTQG